MHHLCGTVVPLLIGHAPRVLGHLNLLEQIGVIAFFAPADVVTPIIVKGLDVGGIGTEAVFGDNDLEVRVVLASLGHEAFGSMAFPIICACAIVFHDRLGPQRNHCTTVRMDDRCTQHLVIIRDQSVPVGLWQTRGTVHGLGGKIPRAIEPS